MSLEMFNDDMNAYHKYLEDQMVFDFHQKSAFDEVKNDFINSIKVISGKSGRDCLSFGVLADGKKRHEDRVAALCNWIDIEVEDLAYPENLEWHQKIYRSQKLLNLLIEGAFCKVLPNSERFGNFFHSVPRRQQIGGKAWNQAFEDAAMIKIKEWMENSANHESEGCVLYGIENQLVFRGENRHQIIIAAMMMFGADKFISEVDNFCGKYKKFWREEIKNALRLLEPAAECSVRRLKTNNVTKTMNIPHYESHKEAEGYFSLNTSSSVMGNIYTIPDNSWGFGSPKYWIYGIPENVIGLDESSVEDLIESTSSEFIDKSFQIGDVYDFEKYVTMNPIERFEFMANKVKYAWKVYNNTGIDWNLCYPAKSDEAQLDQENQPIWTPDC
jgi:hypothetical protein